jgi:triosephosphate isomerase (TIM)
MHGSRASNDALLDALLPSLRTQGGAEVALCPPYPYLQQVGARLAGTALALGAQNVSEHKQGAFTGEVSAAMLEELGCSYVIVGHSERRQLFGETDAGVARKAKAALACGLVPIICVGESLAERDAGQTLDRVGAQLDAALEPQTTEEISRCVIAYEPVWAIGTGRNATPAQAVEVHHFLRGRLAGRLGVETARSIRILYGGSVKPDNIAALMGAPEIDGALVGGASLTVDSFVRIVKEGTSACTGS